MQGDLTLLSDSQQHIETVREQCRRMVRRRAAIAAGVGAVPIPGVDVLSDMTMFARLVQDVNHAFGLDAEQIDKLAPHYKQVAWKAALGAGVGGGMVGKLITRKLVLGMFKKVAGKMVTKSVARFVPLAGQVAAAAIGFSVFRRLGYEHVEACSKVAQQVAQAKLA